METRNRYWIEEYDIDRAPLAYRQDVVDTEPFIKESLLDEIKDIHKQYKDDSEVNDGYSDEPVVDLWDVINNLIIALNKKGE